MVRKRRITAAVAAALIVLGAASYAVAGAMNGPPNPPDTSSFQGELNGFQEVPSVSTGGFGEIDAKLVGDEMIEYTFQYAGLEGGASLFAHIHFAQRNVNGGVSVFLCGGGGKPPCPPVEGTITGTLVPADVVGPNAQGIEAGSWAELLRALRAGHTYANIHTTRWPGGEIRGQINDNDHRTFE
jgi:CHRD domain